MITRIGETKNKTHRRVHRQTNIAKLYASHATGALHYVYRSGKPVKTKRGHSVCFKCVSFVAAYVTAMLYS